MVTHKYRGKIVAPRLAKIGSKIQYAASMCDLKVTQFYEDRGLFKTSVTFTVEGEESGVAEFERWYRSI